jgi:hypothetical protein
MDAYHTENISQDSQKALKPVIVPTTINTTSKLLDRKKNNTSHADGSSSVERSGSPLSINSIDEAPLSLHDLNDEASVPSGNVKQQQPKRRRSLIDRKKNRSNTTQPGIEHTDSLPESTPTVSASTERDISAVVSQFTSSVKLSMIQTISPVLDNEGSEDSALDMSNETPNSLLDGEGTEFTGPIVPELSALPCFFEDFAPFSDPTRRKSKNQSPHMNSNAQQQQQQRRSSGSKQPAVKKPTPMIANSLSYSRDGDDANSVGGNSVNSDNGVKRISSIQPFRDSLRPQDPPTHHNLPYNIADKHNNTQLPSQPVAITTGPPLKSSISGLFQSMEPELSTNENNNPNPVTSATEKLPYDAVIAGMVMHHYYAKLIDLMLEGIRPGILKIFRLIELVTFSTPVNAESGEGSNPSAGPHRRRSSTAGGSMISVRGSILGGVNLEGINGGSNTNTSTGTISNNNNIANNGQKPRRRSSMMNMLDTDSLQLLETMINKVSAAAFLMSTTNSRVPNKTRRGSSITVPTANVNYHERSQELSQVFELLTQVHNTNENYKSKVQQMIGYMLGLESTDDFLSHVVCLQEANEFFQENPKGLLNGKMWDISHIFYSSKLLLYFFGKDDFKSPNANNSSNQHGSLTVSVASANHLMLQKSPAVIDDVLSMELLHCVPTVKELFQLMFSLEKQYKQSFAQYMTNPILMRRMRKQAIGSAKKEGENTSKGAATTHIPIRTSRNKRSQSILNSPLTLKKNFRIPTFAVNVEQMISKTESVIAKLLYLLVPHHMAIMEIMYRISLIQQSCTRNSSYYKMIGRKDIYKILKKCASAMDMQLDMDIALLARAPETIGKKTRFDAASMNTALNGNKISEKIHALLLDLDNQYGIVSLHGQGNSGSGSLTTTALQTHNQLMNTILEDDNLSVGSRSSGGLESYSSMNRAKSPANRGGTTENNTDPSLKPITAAAVPMLSTGRNFTNHMHYVLQESQEQLKVINQYRDALEQQRESTSQTKLLEISSSSSDDDDDESETSDDDTQEDEIDPDGISVYSDATGSRSDESSVNSRASKSNKVILPVGSNLTTGSMNLFDSFSKTSKLTNQFPEMHILSTHAHEQDKHFDKLAYELSLLQEEYSKKVQDILSLTIEDMDMILKSNVSVQNISRKLLESSFKRDESILPSIAVLLLRAKSKELLQSVYLTWPLLALDIPVTVTSTAPIIPGSNPLTGASATESSSTPRMITSPESSHKRRTSISSASEGGAVPSTSSVTTALIANHPVLPTLPHLTEEFQPMLTRKLDFSQVDFTKTKSLRKLGFSLLQLRDSQLYTWSQLLAAGYPLQEIKHLRNLSTNHPFGTLNGSSSFILAAASADTTQPATAPVLDGTIPQHELTVSELRKAGYSIEQCVEAGFNAMALKAGGFDELQLVQSGLFTANQLKKAGCDVQRFALTTFFNVMDGKFWRRNTNWCTEKPLGEWYGVKVNQQGAVIYIDLRNNQLTGTFQTPFLSFYHVVNCCLFVR